MTDSRAMNTAPSITRLTDYESFPFTIDSVDLTFELDPTQTRVTQLSKVRRTVLATNGLELNGKDLKRISIKIDGVEVEAGQAYFWCACGKSANQPFCDGSHRGSEFSPVKYVADADREVYFCGCKSTGNQPLCDGSHKR